MMRKVSHGRGSVRRSAPAAATVALQTQTHVLTGAQPSRPNSDTYRNLNLFGDVFEKIRTDYVEKPDEGKLVEAAINGMLTSLDPHSSYMDAKSLPRYAGADARRIRRARHRGQRRRTANIKVVTPDRRHARLQGRHPVG